jgi:hypothetical protein
VQPFECLDVAGGSGRFDKLRGTGSATTIFQKLQALVAYPREDLDRELKGWLDLDDGENAASLMKAVLALANHGGGFVLIGFTEELGTWVEDEAGRPADLMMYGQTESTGWSQATRSQSSIARCTTWSIRRQALPIRLSSFPRGGCRSAPSATAQR